MKIAYFDCFSGAAGDMILGAMLDAGLDADALRSDLARLRLTDYEIDVRRVKKQGFAATKLDVRAADQQAHRHLHHITKIIDAADLSDRVKDLAKRIFTRLAVAEAAVHGTTIEKVHFHEVGAVDALVDIVGSAIGVERLGLDRVFCSPIPTGSGTVTCQHGVMPVPAPATAELLKGVPLAASEEAGELTTPTGAAILTELAVSFGPLPAMKIGRIGYGAGTRDGKQRPNVLRLIIGETLDTASAVGDQSDQIAVLETNLDDATGEQIGHAVHRLFEAGALDVFTIPIQMKKGRPGVLLSVLAPIDKDAELERVLFAETTTFGIRRSVWTRAKLDRRMDAVQTKYGPIRVKIGLMQGEAIRVAPEYDDCAAAAKAHAVPLESVMNEARVVWSGAAGSKES